MVPLPCQSVAPATRLQGASAFPIAHRSIARCAAWWLLQPAGAFAPGRVLRRPLSQQVRHLFGSLFGVLGAEALALHQLGGGGVFARCLKVGSVDVFMLLYNYVDYRSTLTLKVLLTGSIAPAL